MGPSFETRPSDAPQDEVTRAYGAKKPMPKPTLTFWYEFASTYSWLAAEPIEALAAAESAENKAALRAATEQAGAQGVYGAPSFVTSSGELFWGNDRLEQALVWAKRETA